jgi:PDZ domain-containing protein
MERRRGRLWGRILWVVAGLVVLGAISWFVPTGDIVFAPGITGNLAQMVKVKGGHVPRPGQLLMVAIDVAPANLLVWALAHVDNAYRLYPMAAVLPTGMNLNQYIQYNYALMDTSQQDAIVAGERLAGEPAKAVPESGLLIAGILRHSSAARGHLRVGDRLVAVNGQALNLNNFRRILGRYHEGQHVVFTYIRNGVAHTVSLVLQRVPGDPVPGIGVVVTQGTRFVIPRPVTINAGDIGGPSAGMMFALEIYEQITGRNLAAGRIVAGTGEITPSGQVLQIGGVAQKVITVYRAGARVFLCPAANFAAAEAMARSRGYRLKIYPVTTLAQAVHDLATSS